jgi:hypothetical protein
MTLGRHRRTFAKFPVRLRNRPVQVGVATDRSGFKWLHRSLTERFSREEIGALCLSLDIPREDVLVGGETILAAANRLIEFCRHHGKEDALASLVVEARPHAKPTPLGETAAVTPALSSVASAFRTCFISWTSITTIPTRRPVTDTIPHGICAGTRTE